MLIFAISLTTAPSTYAINFEAKKADSAVGLVGEQKLINSGLPSVSADIVNSIVSKKENSVKYKEEGVNSLDNEVTYSEENIRVADEILKQLGFLYLALEEAEKEYMSTNTGEIAMAIKDMEADIILLEKELEERGAIFLTPQQVEIMFAEVNTQVTRAGEYEPPDTVNTRYALFWPFTMSTTQGSLKYYYVTATALSTNSNMWSSEFIPMNEDRVSQYVNAVVDVYVGKVTGAVIGTLGWWTNFAPWELLLDPPSSHYSTLATYTITAQYVTNNRFIWCYSNTTNDYYLGLVLNSTSIREVHDNSYVYNGHPYGTSEEKTYTIDSDNFYSVGSVTREYWEGNETFHIEYIDEVEYTYNDKHVTSINPPYAQGYYEMN